MDIGFTQNEARTYKILLELNEAQTGVLCDKLKIPSSHIYRILKSLIEKGVVSYKVVNNIKIFRPNNPESLNAIYLKKKDELEIQRKQIQESITNLKKIPIQKEHYSDYKYFEGISGIKSMWLEMIDILEPNTEVYAFISIEEGFKTLNAFYLEEFHKPRAKKKIHEKMIMSKNDRKYAKQRLKLGYFEPRFMDLDNEAEFFIYEGNIILQYTNKKTPRGFLIKDPIFAHTFKSIFNHLWKQAKP